MAFLDLCCQRRCNYCMQSAALDLEKELFKMMKDSIYLGDVSNQIVSALGRVAGWVNVLQLLGRTMDQSPLGAHLGLWAQPGFEALSDIWVETRIKSVMINIGLVKLFPQSCTKLVVVQLSSR